MSQAYCVSSQSCIAGVGHSLYKSGPSLLRTAVVNTTASHQEMFLVNSKYPPKILIRRRGSGRTALTLFSNQPSLKTISRISNAISGVSALRLQGYLFEHFRVGGDLQQHSMLPSKQRLKNHGHK